MVGPVKLHVVSVVDRALSIKQGPVIIEDGIGVNCIDFEFDSEWDGLDVNFFLSDGVSPAHRFNYTGESAKIPAALIQNDGVLQVGVIGYSGKDVRLTAAKMVTPFTVAVQSVPIEDEPPEPIEDIYGQITGALNDVTELDKKVTESLSGLSDLVEKANTAIDYAVRSAAQASTAATSANDAAKSANDAADRANQAAMSVGEKLVEVFNDPDADDRVIIKYPSFLKSDDGASIYMNVSGGDYNG